MTKQQTYPFWLGGVGASMAAACTHPLDLTKVRMQTTAHSNGGPKPSMFSVLRTTITETGARSLYTGLSASILRQMTYSMVRLGSYDKIKGVLAHKNGNGKITTGQMLIASVAAGGLGGIAGNPADILLVRMTSDSVRPPESRYGYRNAIDGLIRLVREEGVKGLARGLGTNTTRAVLMNASQVGSYDYFKTSLLAAPLPILDYQFQDNLLCHTVASFLAGTVATTVCAPADVMKSRLMSASEKCGALELLKQSLSEEGPRFLFKGWTPAFIRLGPNTVLMFVFYEQLRKGWRTLFPAS